MPAMWKPMRIQVRVHGRTAFLTCCGAGADGPQAEAAFDAALRELPADLEAIVLDIEYGPSSSGAGAGLLRLAGAYGSEHAVPVAVIAERVGVLPALPHLTPTLGPPRPGSDEALTLLRHAVYVRALEQRAHGIRSARRGTHPCD
ncbi:hypothetical protein [Streptomyces sp. NPDC054838]